MSKLVAARLIVLAGAFALSACSLAGPDDRKFVTVQPALANMNAQLGDRNPNNKVNPKKEPNLSVTPSEEAAMKSAVSACKTETRNKGVKSVLAIVTFMRPGAVDAAYVECMQKRGYDVAK